MATVFEYQTRYDGVFEQAYPQNNPTKHHHESPSTEGESAKSKKEQSSKVSDKATPSVEVIQQDNTAEAIKSSLTKADKINEFPVIENSSYSMTNGDLDVKFVIRNPVRSDRAQGFLWGVAEYEYTNGEMHYISSPAGMLS